MAVFNPGCNSAAETTTLLQLRTRTLIRLGFGAQVANPPPGMADLIDEFLSSAQTQLFLRYPELNTERFFTWTTVVDQRFYAINGNDEQTAPMPCTKVLDPLKITWAGIEDANGSWFPLASGIDPRRYTSASQNGFPDSYEIRQEIEVFPAPREITYKIRFKGHFALGAFAVDADVVTLDPELVFLLALANAKAHYQQTDAQLYFTQATSYLGLLTAGAHGTQRYVPGTVEIPPETRPILLPLP